MRRPWLLAPVNQLSEVFDKADDNDDSRSGQAYEEYDFEEPHGEHGDCLHRLGW